MLQRAITSLFFLIAMLAGLLIHPVGYCMLLSLLAAVCLWEYGGLVFADNPKKNLRSGLIAFIGLLYCGVYSYGLLSTRFLGGMAENLILISVGIFLTPLLLVFELYTKDKEPFKQVGFKLLGLIYIITPFIIALTMGVSKGMNFESDDHGHGHSHYGTVLNFTPLPLLGCLLLIWANDVFAYLSGRLLGRNKFFERISPKKTWEGTIGGFVMAMVVGYLLSIVMPIWGFNKLNTIQWLVVAVLCSVAGTIGDLVESMLKRSLGIKDSGNILPGHGGFLDRFDAFLLAMPFAGIFILMMKGS